jgi:type VI secretion system protein VasJ
MSSDLVKLISEPISTDNPSGTLLEDDPDLDKFSNEIQKLSSVQKDPITGEYISDTIDWEAVVQAGTEILIRKSKDLSVASYLCIGLFQEQGYSGLSTGIQIFVALLENFWETLYPPIRRMRGREAAILRLLDKIGPEITKKEPAESGAEALRDCVKHIQKLSQLVSERFGESSLNFSSLGKAIQVQALKVKMEEPSSLPKTEAAERPPERVATGATAPSTTAEMEFTSVSNAHQFILKAAAYIRESNPADPVPYRISRAIKWQPIEQTLLAKANKGKTQIPGILPQNLKAFKDLIVNAEWDILLRQSENRFPDSPLWFDLQRYIDRAMKELGESYGNAQRAIREELASLVRRLPGILDLQFNNGIPFADAQTRIWIDAEVLPSVSPAVDEDKALSSTIQSGKTSDEEDLDRIFAEARRLIGNGSFQDAVLLLKEKLATAPLRREQFLWKLNLAKICFEAGHERLALPQLESLDNEVRQFSLEQWEPNLSVEVLRTLLQCKRKVMLDAKYPQAEINKQTNELYTRLCQLDLLSAMSLDTGT